MLDESGRDVVRASYDALAALEGWDTTAIEEALRVALIEGMELKPRVAFGPVRVAVSGKRISPPLFESMELLGREFDEATLIDLAHGYERFVAGTALARQAPTTTPELPVRAQGKRGAEDLVG